MAARTTRLTRWRLASRLLAALAVILLILWPVTYWRPVSCALSRLAITTGGRHVLIAWGSDPIRYRWGSDQHPWAEFVGAYVGIIGSPGGPWFPTVNTDRMSSAGRAYSITTLWIPAWWPPTIVAVLTAVAWWRASMAPGPGHCPRCAYDLTGLAPGSPCPECGPRNETPAPGATLAAAEPRP